MNQLTLRGFEPELELQIKKTAEALGTSLNKAVLHLLRKSSELERDIPPGVIGHRLDHLFGDWTDEEEQEFREAVRGLGDVEEQVWP